MNSYLIIYSRNNIDSIIYNSFIQFPKLESYLLLHLTVYSSRLSTWSYRLAYPCIGCISRSTFVFSITLILNIYHFSSPAWSRRLWMQRRNHFLCVWHILKKLKYLKTSMNKMWLKSNYCQQSLIRSAAIFHTNTLHHSDNLSILIQTSKWVYKQSV